MILCLFRPVMNSTKILTLTTLQMQIHRQQQLPKGKFMLIYMQISRIQVQRIHSKCEPFWAELSNKIRRTTDLNEESLIKKLLERIDNAVKKPNRNMFPSQTLHSDVLKDLGDKKEQMHFHDLEKEQLDNLRRKNAPFWGIAATRNQTENLKYNKSVVYNSDWNDVDHFTLGPLQYSNIKPSNHGFQQVKQYLKYWSKDIPEIQNMKRNYSVDKLINTNNAMYFNWNQINNQQLFQNQMQTWDNRKDILKHTKSSMQINGQIDNFEENLRVIIDDKFWMDISSLNSNADLLLPNKREPNRELISHKCLKPHKSKAYYSHSPPSHLNQPNNIESNFKMKNGKLNEHRVFKQKEGSKLQIMQKRIVKAGPNAKKFPKDFF